MTKGLMEMIGDVDRELAQRTAQGAPASQPFSQADASVVNALFMELYSIFPAWKHALPTDKARNAAKRQWTAAMVENGINTKTQINYGLAKARQSGESWFPSVGQFVTWCQPTTADLGLPTVHEAFKAACQFRPKKLHAVVSAARHACDPMVWVRMPRDKAFTLFEHHYAVMVRRYANGEDLGVAAPKPLPATVELPPASNEVALRHIANIKKILQGAA
ncbi:MAG: replication protein P [Porticoccaceae bacterium]|nr:replication protein P [Porticoccaceae bacterium]